MPSPDELDELLGFPQGYTKVAGVTDLQREQLIGTTMHVAVIKRILEDLPTKNSQEPEAANAAATGTTYSAPQQSTFDILEHI